MSTTLIREIKFPEINWAKLGEGSLPKEETVGKIRDIIKFLVNIQMLKRTSFLAQSTRDKANEVSLRLNESVEQFPQLKGVVQNLFGQLVKEMAEENGDSKSLFSRLELLVEEAAYYGILQEWAEEKLEISPLWTETGFPHPAPQRQRTVPPPPSLQLEERDSQADCSRAPGLGHQSQEQVDGGKRHPAKIL